jgi:hypothetical protein
MYVHISIYREIMCVFIRSNRMHIVINILNLITIITSRKFKILKSSLDEKSDFTGVQYPGSEYTETEFIRFCKALRMIEVQRLRERCIRVCINICIYSFI